MIIREYQDADRAEIQRLYCRSGFDYVLPESLSREEFFARYVVPDKNKLAMAVFLRATCEPYLLVDTDWRTPAWRMEALKQLHSICEGIARQNGIREAHAFLPPQIEKVFGRRLLRMGWQCYQEQEWKCYAKELTNG